MKVIGPFKHLCRLLRRATENTPIRGTLNYGHSCHPGVFLPQPIYNSFQSVSIAVNKKRTHDILELAGLSPPLATIGEVSDDDHAFIYKPLRGMKSRGIYFSNRAEEVPGYVCQVYVPIRDEYRILVVGNTVAAIMRKVKYSEEANPYLRGSEVGWEWRKRKPSQNDFAEQAAIRATRAIGLDVGGADVGIGYDHHAYVFEVNAASWLNKTLAELVIKALATNDLAPKKITWPREPYLDPHHYVEGD